MICNSEGMLKDIFFSFVYLILEGGNGLETTTINKTKKKTDFISPKEKNLLS